MKRRFGIVKIEKRVFNIEEKELWISSGLTTRIAWSLPRKKGLTQKRQAAKNSLALKQNVSGFMELQKARDKKIGAEKYGT